MSQLVKRICRRRESGWWLQKARAVLNITSAHLFFGYPNMPLEMAARTQARETTMRYRVRTKTEDTPMKRGGEGVYREGRWSAARAPPP